MPDKIKRNKSILQLVKQLELKYTNSGQDLEDYLKGLLEANYEPYWEYINLESLLALQQPKTDHPDELIFITYHQYTELFFKLILHELSQLSNSKKLEEAIFLERVNRINRYFSKLTDSFDIMIDGMDPEQFLKFRMALLPASGFQSAQYRFIEIALTPLENLIHSSTRSQINQFSLQEKIDNLYWKKGAINLKNNEKTLTLKQFEAHYDNQFGRYALFHEKTNLWNQYLNLNTKNKTIKVAMRNLDYHINVGWPLSHYKAAVKYLKSKSTVINATGGTNWTSYLPPRFQKIISFPPLWTKKEQAEWGKAWVLGQL